MKPVIGKKFKLKKMNRTVTVVATTKEFIICYFQATRRYGPGTNHLTRKQFQQETHGSVYRKY